MKILGAILIVIGLVSLVYGGFSYSREKTVLDIGPSQATATEHHRVPFSPILGGLALLVGVVLVVIPRRMSA
jgi:drug/metabolite transporter (DMT)-like permease